MDEGISGIMLEKNNYPLISIVIPIYNSNKNYLEKSIKSCLNQTYRNIELIIVEDGSEKDSEKFVKTFSDVRIKYIKKQKNEKLPMALNTGFKAAKGQYLTWTSDDNIYLEKAIETMYNFLAKNPEYEFVYANFFHINEKGEIIQSKNVEPIEKLREYNCIGPCFLFSRAVYERIGEYNSREFLVEDYEYWLRVSKQFKMQKLNESLYYHRLHPDSLTCKYEFKIKYRACQIRKKHLDSFNSRKDFSNFYYTWGQKLYKKNIPKNALKMLLKSFILNPLHSENRVLIAKTLVILILPNPLIGRLSSIRTILCKKR